MPSNLVRKKIHPKCTHAHTHTQPSATNCKHTQCTVQANCKKVVPYSPPETWAWCWRQPSAFQTSACGLRTSAWSPPDARSPHFPGGPAAGPPARCDTHRTPVYNNNNRLFMVPHLVRAQSTCKAIRIHSFHHTHTRTQMHTPRCMCTHPHQIHALLVMDW